MMRLSEFEISSIKTTIKPATVLEIEMYSDDQIVAWDAEDQLSPDERSAIRPSRRKTTLCRKNPRNSMDKTTAR